MADNFEKIKCPACNNEMKKVFIPTVGINVDVCCDGCGGIYFDNREYYKFDEPHEDADVIFNELANKTLTQIDENAKRICPCCGATMVKNYSSIKRQIQIDECYKCGAKFLDGGELQKIRDEYPSEEARQADFTNRIYALVGKEYELIMEANRKWEQERAENFTKTLCKRLMRVFSFGLFK